MPRSRQAFFTDDSRPSDGPEIVALTQKNFGRIGFAPTGEELDWKQRGSGTHGAVLSVVRRAEDEHPVGFVWTVPLRMRILGEDRLGALGASLILNRDYRGTVAYALLMRHRERRVRELGIDLRFNFPTGEYFTRVEGIGEKLVIRAPNLVRALAPPEALEQLANRETADLAAGLAEAAPAVPKLVPDADGEGLRLEWLAAFDERFDRFWLAVTDSYPVMVVRDRSFLSWRFPALSTRSYRILLASEGSRPLGYVVLRCTDEIFDIPAGLIADFLVEPTARGLAAGKHLIAEALRYFEEEGMLAAGGLLLPHTREHGILEAMGFVPLTAGLMPEVVMEVRCYSADLRARVTEPHQLFTSLADYEIH